MPLWFTAITSKALDIADVEQLEITVGGSIEIESVWLEKENKESGKSTFKY